MKNTSALFARSTKRTSVFVLAIIFLSAAGYYYYTNILQPAQTTTSEPELQTATIRRGDLIIYASGSGALISANEASFGFGTSGQVVNVLVGVGDSVETKQILAQLDDTSAQNNLTSAQREYLELTSQASIATAKQNVFDTEDSLNAARATLGWLISPSVLTWEERVIATEVSLHQAKADNASNEKIADAEQSLTLAQANLTSSQNAYYSYLQENFVETETVNSKSGTHEIIVRDEDGRPIINYPTDLQIGLARSNYELAQANLQEARWYLATLQGEEIPENATGPNLAALENARVSLENAQSNLETTQLVAPIAGTVMSMDFSLGDTVGTSSVVTIADLSRPYLEIYLDETDWANVSVGYPVEVIFDILPDRIFAGEIIQVAPSLFTSGNTSVVRALVELDASESLNLPLGTSASIDVIGGRAENALLVPVDALRETSPGEYAVFVIEDGKPRLRVIEIGIQDLFYAEVLTGLDVGDVVSTGLVETE